MTATIHRIRALDANPHADMWVRISIYSFPVGICKQIVNLHFPY